MNISMLNVETARVTLFSNDEVQKRTAVLRRASEINPEFKNPYITGGMLRDILLGEEPRDCDVVFEGIKANQEGVLEAVQEAEARLGMNPLPGWEFENTYANGTSNSIIENTIGFYSNHTDFLTLLMVNGEEELHIGDEKTLPHLESRIYDPRYQGMMVWMGLRGRTYHEVLTGDAIRGLYLTHRLNLTPSEHAEELFYKVDEHFAHLTPEQQARRRTYWAKKTADVEDVDTILKQYNVTCLS